MLLFALPGQLPSIQKNIGARCSPLPGRLFHLSPFLSPLSKYKFGYHCSIEDIQGMIPHKRFQDRKWLMTFPSVRQPLICNCHTGTQCFPSQVKAQSSCFRSLQPKFAYHSNTEFVLREKGVRTERTLPSLCRQSSAG